MSSANELTSMEVMDDIESLLFLCDRLRTRLMQVTSYVDEVKQTWMDKRQSIEADSNVSPIIAQKAVRCNKVLLNVAEKLAVVELQTECLYNLQSTNSNRVPIRSEKTEVSSPRLVSTPMLSAASATHRLERDVPTAFARPLNIGTHQSSSSSMPRSTSALLRDSSSANPPLERPQASFQRSVPAAVEYSPRHAVASPQNLLTSRPDSVQANLSNGSIKDLPLPSTNSLHSHSSSLVNESIETKVGKIRIKMQVIAAGTIWRNADIPIADHPSAFFVSNQDPRIAEQFHLMSVEMNNYYAKPANSTIPLPSVSVGDFCAARFSEDQSWYRARVVVVNSDSIHIVYIDYGNSEPKLRNEIFPLTESLARLPAMTVACTLTESFPRNEVFWTSEATETFTNIVKNRIVEVRFQPDVGKQWPLHFVKVVLDGQAIAEHPKLAPFIVPIRNEQIASHFSDKLTPVEYILYNVATRDADVYSNNLS